MSANAPTRWRHLVKDQLTNATQRVERAERYVVDEDGSRAMQEVYPVIVTLATIRVWMDAPPWEEMLPPDEMRRRVQEQFPNLFAALSELDVQQVLTRPWAAADAEPYVLEARSFFDDVSARAREWMEGK
jgi:hypothetical protein